MWGCLQLCYEQRQRKVGVVDDMLQAARATNCTPMRSEAGGGESSSAASCRGAPAA
jgi:hypothetical protein